MKRLNDLYNHTYELNNIIEMTDKVLKNVRNKKLSKLRNSTKKRFKKKVKYLRVLKENNYIDSESYRNKLSSYKGLLKYGNCRTLYYRSVRI